ncbi:hypothetical protein [Nocardia heshunensis]
MPTDDDERQRRTAEAARREKEQQQRERERGKKANERGEHFHRGMAQERGETPERGWQHERTVQTSLGGRRHDTARVDKDGRTKEFTEYKNQRHVRADALMQLAKDREILERDAQARGTWVLREDSRVDPMVQRQLEKMQRLFGDRFVLELATREQAKHAQHIGKELERAKTRDQLELIPTEKLQAQQRAKERADRVREVARVQEAATRALKAREREERARQKQLAIEAREQQIRAQLPNLPADVAMMLARSSPTAAEAARISREAVSEVTRGGREAERALARERDVIRREMG